MEKLFYEAIDVNFNDEKGRYYVSFYGQEPIDFDTFVLISILAYVTALKKRSDLEKERKNNQ